ALVTQAPRGIPLVCFGVFRSLREAPPLETVSGSPDAPMVWTPQLSRAAHALGVSTIREAIADGVTYQINYTFRLFADVDSVRSPGPSAPGTIAGLYAHLASAEQVPYAALVETDEWSVLSLSPELFFERDGNRLTTKPMKGTAPRGR